MIKGYILAGGHNRRMNGDRKLFLKYEGVSFYNCICRALSELPEIWLSVDEEEPYRETGMKLVKDRYPNTGPLGGICSGFSVCEEEDALFVIACDMPLVRKEQVERLCGIYRNNPDRPVVVQSGGRIHPLFGVYPASCHTLMEQQIEHGDFRMMHFLERAEAVTVMMKDDPTFSNVNTPSAYQKLQNPDHQKRKPVVFAVSGYKNSGKTTLLTAVIPILTGWGYRVAVIKHDGHDFVPDIPGTDSFRHREAGAYGTAVFSSFRFLITREWGVCSPDETALMKAFPEADIILVEGLKNSSYPRYFCRYPEETPVDPMELALTIRDHVLQKRIRQYDELK